MNNTKSKVLKYAALTFWILLIVICLINKDNFTVENVANISTENMVIAFLIMLCLFAIKSVSIFMYGGILYAASGIIFSLPMAIVMNIVGTFVMISIPFMIGKKGGSGIVDKLNKKYPKTLKLRDIQNQNDFILSFITRIIGLLPADLIGIYFGASGVNYKNYLLGSMLGLFPSMISFSVMGMSINDPTSPLFIGSVVFEIALIVVSVTGSYILKKRKAKNNSEGTLVEK